MTLAFLVPVSAGILTGLASRISDQLIQEHLSGTSRKFFVRSAVGTFLGLSLLYLMHYGHPTYFVGHLIFTFLIGITLFTDVRVMLISRYVTVYAIPAGLALSFLGLLPISLYESMFGSLAGFILLTIVARLSKAFLGQDGIGQGDVDLLAMVGSFTGPVGCWFTILAGSLIGSLVGIMSITMGESQDSLKLPFGVFLGMGSILFILFSKNIYSFLLAPLH